MQFRHSAFSLGVIAALLAPVTATPAAAAPAAVAPVTAPGTVAPAAPVAYPGDATYLKTAHQVNLAEIAAGRVAWTKTTDPDVKNLAATFMRDHIRLDAALYPVARSLRVALPPAPNPEQQSLTRQYQAAGADTFDEFFIATQLAAHRASLALTRAAVEHADARAVRNLAARAAPVIEGHHDRLRAAAAAANLVGYTQPGGRH